MAENGWHFGEFRFDAATEALSRRGQPVPLSPKASAVLRCLLEQGGRLVAKDDLLDRVWPDSAVSDASLKVCIGEIRRALGDAVATERYIATVHRRGYRFVAALAQSAEAAPPVESLVGRAAPLAVLAAALADAGAGARQTVLVTGEAGIGKSRIVEAVLATAQAQGALVGRGRCVAHSGPGEPYLPVLEALGDLGRGLGRDALADVLRRHAPSWLAQLPEVIDPAERAALGRASSAGTRERVLRELTDALEAVAERRTVVLALEDLHWSDPSTLDVLARLAQRREPARLLLVGSFRPVDAIVADHPVKALKQRLLAQRAGAELALEPLREADVAAYLAARLDAVPPPHLAGAVHRRTDGNPLFMVTAIAALLDGGLLVRTANGWELRDDVAAIAARIPESVRALVEQQLESLAPDDAALLEAAALAGDEFPAALAAAALTADRTDVERRCADLHRAGYWLRAVGGQTLADGTPSDRYRFVHPLHRAVLADRVPAARRAARSLRIGEWLEREHAAAPERIAAAVADHFEAGRDAPRAIAYRRLAARTAAARHAHREAAAELSRALRLVERLPADDREPARRALLEQRGAAASAMGDVDGAIADFSALVAATREGGGADEEVQALLALGSTWSLRDRGRGLALAADAVGRSAAATPELRQRARAAHAYWWARQHGWRAAEAEAVAETVAAMRAAGTTAALAVHLGMHAFFRALRGDYAGACAAAEEALPLARDGGTALLAQWQRCWALRHLRRWRELLLALAEARRMAERDGHRLWGLLFEQLTAWTLADAGAVVAARSRAEAARKAAAEKGHTFGIVLGAVVAGVAALRDDDLDAAASAFADATAIADSDPAAMEWPLRAPLHLGRAALAAGRGDRAGAAAERAAAAQLAAQSGSDVAADAALDAAEQKALRRALRDAPADVAAVLGLSPALDELP